MHKRTCASCGALFEPWQSRHIYCSAVCRERAKYTGRERIPCRICGEPTSWVVGARQAPAAPKHKGCPSEHGTISRYKSGCRCESCRSEVARRQRDLMQRQRATPHRTCGEPGCDKVHKVHGMCGMHLRRKQKADGTWKPSPSDAWDTPKRLAGYKRRKALTRGGLVSGDRFTVHDLLARDGRACGICGTNIPDVEYPDPQSPSIDHITPLSLGGEHTLTNARAAHWRCNVRRGNRTDVRMSA